VEEMEGYFRGWKVAFATLGCKVNAYETEAMKRLFVDSGAEIVDFDALADIYVVNTCTVTNIADKKSRQMLHRAKAYNPAAVVVAVGCYVQVSPGELEDDSSIDLMVGNDGKKDIAGIIRRYVNHECKNADGEDVNPAEADHMAEHGDSGMGTLFERTRAFVKIQDGCNQFCSYCIIPYARGRARSRDERDIIKEVGILAEKGYKEIVLTGINLSAYGGGRGSGVGNDGTSRQPLLGLIRELEKVGGVRRIRLSSLEPGIVTEGFVRGLSECRKVCPHFHLSLQSGCDDTLSRMGRKYTVGEYEGRVSMLRTYYDDPAITTDILTGFPGETDAEFLETMAFVEKIGFSRVHVFAYSRRKGTKARDMEGQVGRPTKRLRSEELLRLSKRMKESYEKRQYGKIRDVLFEEMDDDGHMLGYTDSYVRAAIRTERNLTNQIIRVRLLNHYKDDILLSEHCD